MIEDEKRFYMKDKTCASCNARIKHGEIFLREKDSRKCYCFDCKGKNYIDSLSEDEEPKYKPYILSHGVAHMVIMDSKDYSVLEEGMHVLSYDNKGKTAFSYEKTRRACGTAGDFARNILGYFVIEKKGDFWSKICDICDKPFKPSDFIVKIEGERENYCPKCARSKLLAVNDREKHARYQEYICENVYTWTLARLVMDKRAFSELDNGLYGLKYHKSYDMKNSKMLYGRRKYIYETVEEFAYNTISNCILEKSDDFTCLFFDQFISEKEEYFVEPEGKLKDMMDYLSEWTGKDVELIVDRNGYVRGFICGSETCDESLILKEYYSGKFTVKMVGYLD